GESSLPGLPPVHVPNVGGSGGGGGSGAGCVRARASLAVALPGAGTVPRLADAHPRQQVPVPGGRRAAPPASPGGVRGQRGPYGRGPAAGWWVRPRGPAGAGSAPAGTAGGVPVEACRGTELR